MAETVFTTTFSMDSNSMYELSAAGAQIINQSSELPEMSELKKMVEAEIQRGRVRQEALLRVAAHQSTGFSFREKQEIGWLENSSYR